MKLEAVNISFSYAEKKIIDDCSINLEPGKMTVITGPNGSGKTTLLHLLGGLLKPVSGTVTADGRELEKFSDIQRACTIGVLGQEKAPALDFSVYDRIMMGRFARLPRLFAPGRNDLDAVEHAMKLMGISSFAETPCNRISGGEYQKVLIAALLARQTPVMLLDEPTSALDPAGALAVMRILKKCSAEASVAVVTHDLSLAAAFADELVIVDHGKIFSAGTPEQILTGETIHAVYGCDSEIITSSRGPVVVFR